MLAVGCACRFAFFWVILVLVGLAVVASFGVRVLALVGAVLVRGLRSCLVNSVGFAFLFVCFLYAFVFVVCSGHLLCCYVFG